LVKSGDLQNLYLLPVYDLISIEIHDLLCMISIMNYNYANSFMQSGQSSIIKLNTIPVHALKTEKKIYI